MTAKTSEVAMSIQTLLTVMACAAELAVAATLPAPQRSVPQFSPQLPASAGHVATGGVRQ